MDRIKIGDTGLEVTPLCFGTSPLGSMPTTYGYDVSEELAVRTLLEIFDSPVNFLDTSNNYGFGRSEERVGLAIRERGGLPEDFVLSTKVDRDMDTNILDVSRVRRSFEESLSRLGLDSVSMLHLHDPEYVSNIDDVTCSGGAIDELFKMKEEGLTQSVGLAMGRLDVMFPLLRSYDFDVLISHNRYSLLNRSASEMFDYAHEHNITILNAAPFAGGVLAKGSVEMPRVTYQDADDEGLKPVRMIEDICSRYSVPVGAVALQFSMNDSRIGSTIIGISKPERISQTLDWAQFDIPQAAQDEISLLSYETSDPEANRVYDPG